MGGDHCWVTILYIVPYCCYWEHVEEHFEKLKELMGTAWHSFDEHTKIPKKNENCLEINLGTVPKNKPKPAPI